MTTAITVSQAAWIVSGDGVYSLGSNWSSGVVPTASSTVDWQIAIGDPSVTGAATLNVTSSVSEIVNSIAVYPTATLTIASGNFDVDARSSIFSTAYNFGTINVAQVAALTFGSVKDPMPSFAELQNYGVLNLYGRIQVNNPEFDFFGPGVYNMAGGVIMGGYTPAIANLIVRTATVTGWGNIGAGSALVLNVANTGAINANAAKTLTINTGANAIINDGLIETTGVGQMAIVSDVSNNGAVADSGTGVFLVEHATMSGSGTVSVAAGSAMTLMNGYLETANVTIAAGGKIVTSKVAAPGASQAIDGLRAASGAGGVAPNVIDNGVIAVNDGSTLQLNAMVTGSGSLLLNGASAATSLQIVGGGATFNATGGLRLSNFGGNSIVADGKGEQFVNDALILGSGTIGDGYLELVNNAGAVINANQSVGLTIVGDSAAVLAGSESNDYNAGLVETTGTGGLTLSGGDFDNHGLLEALGLGALVLDNVYVGAAAGGGKVIVAAGASLALANDAAISGQTLVSIAGGGALNVMSGAAASLEGAVTDNGEFDIFGGAALKAAGAWSGAGTLDIGAPTGSATVAIDSGGWSLLGGLDVNLNGGSQIVSAGADEVFNIASATISGSGVIGDANMGSMIVGLNSVIDATGPLALTAKSISNSGTIEASSGATLTIAGAIANSGAVVAMDGGTVVFTGGPTRFGQLDIQGAGTIELGAASVNDTHFSGTGGTLVLDQYTTYLGSIFGFGVGDAVDLRDFAYTGAGTMSIASQSIFTPVDSAFFVQNANGVEFVPLFIGGDNTAATLASENLAFQIVDDGKFNSATGADGTLVKLVSTTTI